MNTKTYFLIFALSCSTFIFSQGIPFKIPDSLKDKGYIDLYYAYIKVKKDTARSLLYLKTYLEKGKRDSDKIEMARGYNLVARYEADNHKKLRYIDSSIAISKSKNNKHFPALAYFSKGNFYFRKGDHKKALNNYLSALDYTKRKENKNEELHVKMEYNIGLIKAKLNKYDEALSMFRKAFVYEKQGGVKDTMDYLISVLTIADTYRKMKHIDSSLYYGREGLLLARLKGYDIYYKFLLNEGINLYYKREYVNAMDSINTSLSFIKTLKDKSFLVDAYFYLGKSNEALKKTDRANAFYKKNDSIFQTDKERIIPEIRQSYESLIRYYEAEQDSKNELIYVKRLLEFDSILNTKYKFLSEKIIKAFDTPKLLAMQEKILTEKNKSYIDFIKISAILFVLICGLFYYQYKKRKTLQKRFEDLIRKDNKDSNDITANDLNPKFRQEIEIAEELIQDILSKFKKFEESLGFLSLNTYKRVLAKQFGTNERYISKIINAYKGKSFTRYINDLRIDYTVKKLQEDSRLIQYSIKAIGEEAGFNNEGTFRAAFKKRTGITPSYFIKQLKKE